MLLFPLSELQMTPTRSKGRTCSNPNCETCREAFVNISSAFWIQYKFYVCDAQWCNLTPNLLNYLLLLILFMETFVKPQCFRFSLYSCPFHHHSTLCGEYMLHMPEILNSNFLSRLFRVSKHNGADLSTNEYFFFILFWELEIRSLDCGKI